MKLVGVLIGGGLLFATASWRPVFGGAPGGEPATEYLSLQNAIALALRNNLGVQIDRISTDIQDERFDAAIGAFDPTLNFRAIHESIKNPQNQREFTATQGAGTVTSRLFEEENYLIEGSVEGLFPIGTQWSIVAEADRLKNTLNIQQPPSLFYPEYDTFVGLRLTQPLLRDFKNNAAATNVRIAATDQELADLGWQLRLQLAVFEVIKNYDDLIFALEDARIKNEAIDLARQLKEANEIRLKQGVASNVEVQQAEVAISVREEALITAQHFYLERQNTLVREISRDFDLTNPRRIRPTSKLSEAVPTQDRASLMTAALQNRVEYLSGKKQLEKQHIQLKYAKNQQWPRIDLVGTLGGNGLNRSYGNSLDGAIGESGLQWSLGVVLSIPLGNETAKAQVRERELERKQLILNLKRTEMDIAIQIDTALSRIRTSEQRLETARESSNLALETLEQENKRLQEGVSNNFELLEIQRQFADAQTRELAALTDLNKSVAELWLADGTLLNKFGVVLEERPVVNSAGK